MPVESGHSPKANLPSRHQKLESRFQDGGRFLYFEGFSVT
jgi:hypothetical protein